MFDAICATRKPSFRMFGRLFMDAGASKKFSVLQTDFIDPKHRMYI
jgi:hypothetical protein